jgi:hypothetical protein
MGTSELKEPDEVSGHDLTKLRHPPQSAPENPVGLGSKGLISRGEWPNHPIAQDKACASACRGFGEK